MASWVAQISTQKSCSVRRLRNGAVAHHDHGKLIRCLKMPKETSNTAKCVPFKMKTTMQKDKERAPNDKISSLTLSDRPFRLPFYREHQLITIIKYRPIMIGDRLIVAFLLLISLKALKEEIKESDRKLCWRLCCSFIRTGWHFQVKRIKKGIESCSQQRKCFRFHLDWLWQEFSSLPQCIAASRATVMCC